MSRRRASLRGRIVWTTAVVTAAAMAAIIGTVVLVLSSLNHRNVRLALDDRLALVASAVQTGDGRLRPLPEPDDAVDDSTWVFDSDGRQVEGPNAGHRVQAVAESLAQVTRRTTLERRDRVYLAAPATRRGSSARAVIVVSESTEPYERIRSEVVAGLGILGLVVTAGSTAIAAWTVRRALAPVESMAARAEDWSEHDLESRFRSDDTATDEITALGHTLNHLLDRVAHALRTEQRLTAELAHELRTPLTAIRGEAELGLLAEPDSRAADRLREVVQLVERMDETISELLAMARGETDRASVADVHEIVEQVVAPHRTRAGLTWSVHVEPARVAAPPALAARALAPLVENAARHARSTVTVRTEPSGRTERLLELQVVDDGPGVVGVDPDDLFTAGVRGPDSPGAGLGLSLARRVARTLGGDVVLVSAAEPTCVALRLPLP